MTPRKKKWLIVVAVLALVTISVLFIAASILSRRFEPYLREQAILYLQERFDSEVELAALRVHMPNVSPIQLLLHRRGFAQVEGEGISVRHKRRRDIPPMFAMDKFSFDVDLATIFKTPKVVPLVVLDGMEINIPPKGQRPDLDSDDSAEEAQEDSAKSTVLIERIVVRNATLSILPKEKQKVPLRFDIHSLELRSVGSQTAMAYDAVLTNPKPPGDIQSKGTFGPWVADEPGDTPLAGDYIFNDADLGIFNGIAGILDSSGKFEGALNSINVHGQAFVPDFRLKMTGKPVPLKTEFDVLVDGTNGNTVLKPVVATLERRTSPRVAA